MYYSGGMKVRVSPVQSIEPHRILAPTRDLNREPLGPQSRVVTTILPLHTKPKTIVNAKSEVAMMMEVESIIIYSNRLLALP